MFTTASSTTTTSMPISSSIATTPSNTVTAGAADGMCMCTMYVALELNIIYACDYRSEKAGLICTFNLNILSSGFFKDMNFMNIRS